MFVFWGRDRKGEGGGGGGGGGYFILFYDRAWPLDKLFMHT